MSFLCHKNGGVKYDIKGLKFENARYEDAENRLKE